MTIHLIGIGYFDSFVDCFSYGENGSTIAVETADLATMFSNGCEYSFAAYIYTGETFAVEDSGCVAGSDLTYSEEIKQLVNSLSEVYPKSRTILNFRGKK